MCGFQMVQKDSTMFTATEFELESGQAGSIQLEIDLAEDGNNDAQGQGRVGDSCTMT